MQLRSRLAAALLIVAVASTAVRAQEAPAKPQPPTAEVALPNADRIVLLVRTALLTLNDAVQTGNFTVLRDKAAPSFQAANTAAQLGIIFQNLVSQRIELSAVAIIAPQLTAPPALDADQRLRLTGYFPGTPVRIEFDLLFEAVAGHWRLFGIAVNPAASGGLDDLPPEPPAKEPAPARSAPSAPVPSKK